MVQRNLEQLHLLQRGHGSVHPHLRSRKKRGLPCLQYPSLSSESSFEHDFTGLYLSSPYKQPSIVSFSPSLRSCLLFSFFFLSSSSSFFFLFLSFFFCLRLFPSLSFLLSFFLCFFLERSQFQLPSLRSSTSTLYMRSPDSLETATRPNLEKPLAQLFPSGTQLSVTDPALNAPVLIEVHFEWSHFSIFLLLCVVLCCVGGPSRSKWDTHDLSRHEFSLFIFDFNLVDFLKTFSCGDTSKFSSTYQKFE